MGENDENVSEMAESVMQVLQATIRQEDQIEQIEQKVEKASKFINKGCFTMHGVKECEDEDPIDVVTSFLQNKLEITSETPIMSAHRMGKKGMEKRPLWFHLMDHDDVGVIFSHVKNLKEKTNEDNEQFLITEQNSEKEREKRNRQCDIIMTN